MPQWILKAVPDAVHVAPSASGQARTVGVGVVEVEVDGGAVVVVVVVGVVDEEAGAEVDEEAGADVDGAGAVLLDEGAPVEDGGSGLRSAQVSDRSAELLKLSAAPLASLTSKRVDSSWAVVKV